MQIEIRDLTKLYKKDRGLQPTSFAVNKGELVAVVGHNGAGKSTMLKILANWICPDDGEVTIEGVNLKDRQGVVRKVGFVPEVPSLFEFFSVEYNLNLFATLFQTPSERVEEILNEFGLMPYRRNRIQVLSKGLKQRVNIGRALLADPPVLLFDEPTSGLDFEMTKEIYRRLNRLHAEEKTILFTSHRPEEIRNLATRILVLHQGRLIFDGNPTEYFQSEVHESLYA